MNADAIDVRSAVPPSIDRRAAVTASAVGADAGDTGDRSDLRARLRITPSDLEAVSDFLSSLTDAPARSPSTVDPLRTNVPFGFDRTDR